MMQCICKHMQVLTANYYVINYLNTFSGLHTDYCHYTKDKNLSILSQDKAWLVYPVEIKLARRIFLL